MRTTTKANSRHRGSSVHRLASLPVVARSRQRGPLRRQPLHRQSAKHLEPAIKSRFRVPARLRPIQYQYDPVQRTKTSVHGAINMLGLAKRLRARILQASTSEVYGDPEIHPQPERYWGRVNPIGPRACYDEGKRCVETLFCRLLPPACTADQGCAELQYVWTQHASKRRSSRVEFHHPGIEQPAHYDFRRRNANAGRSAMSRDLIGGLVALMDTADAVTGPMNLSNPTEFTILELAKKVIAMNGSRSRILYSELPADDPKTRRPDVALAESTIAWAPRVALQGRPHANDRIL